MKNKWWILLTILILIALGLAFFFINKNKDDNNDYSASRTATNNISNSNKSKNTIEKQENSADNDIKIEEEISGFATKIYTKEDGRQNNIAITCSILNDIIVTKGSTFSFCDTVGQATSDRGYQEADIFDKYGNKKKGLGGGNCQVSTTLYNAVLAVPSLVITERHEHSNKVPYIPKGQDAAVAYGSYDFKFRNNSDFDVKIKVVATTDDITVRLYKVKN